MILRKNITDDDYAHIHDVVIDCTGKSLTDKQIDNLIGIMPISIVADACDWGFNDTVVGDNIYEWLEKVGKDQL